MKLVAITGSIGCGKTTLAGIVRQLGYEVFDVDEWVRNIYQDERFLQELNKLFKGCVKDGVADKKYLRTIVFDDKEKLKKLEDLIYPILTKMIEEEINKRSKSKEICFLDIALLYEKGWNKYCDFVILADVAYDIQKRRVMERDNVTAESFEKINNQQMSNEEKKKLADMVINTDKSVDDLKKEMIKIIKKLEQ